MKLGEFIEKFISKNTVIRLLYEAGNPNTCTPVQENWNIVTMEWQILKGTSPNRHYINNEVISLHSIVVQGTAYPEAVNIVIEKLDPQPQVEDTVVYHEAKETAVSNEPEFKLEDHNHYDFDSYTTGRKQDYGHHELNEENGWVCYGWNRDDYTETMYMKKPKEGKGWKPFRLYYYLSSFYDFFTNEEAQKAFDVMQSAQPSSHLKLVQVDEISGGEITTIKTHP